MLVAASSARASHKASCQRFCKVSVSAKSVFAKSSRSSLESTVERGKRTHVTTDRNKNARNKNDRTITIGQKLFHAMAHRNLGGDRGGQRTVLLVSDGAFPTGRRLFSLGVPSRALHVAAPESVQHLTGAVSAHRGFF